MTNPPLGLYIHIPWCVQKCPYCDFNSHGQKGQIPEQQYVHHLLDDLSQEAMLVGDRTVDTVFFGGGTPSLLSADAVHTLLRGVAARVNLSAQAEITLEANPGTVEAARFEGYQQAGINRISVGVQSFQADKLAGLGRIHDPLQATQAIQLAHRIGLTSFNLDLMHGLPGQSLADALSDIDQAIALSPPHLSWYQLTIEPNTQFASRPPRLPEDEILWDIQEQGHQRLVAAGYRQYEISGYSQPGHQCSHNLNYWRFGDYLGIGCGAHGKVTHVDKGLIERRVKVKHPKGYMDLTRPYLDQHWHVGADELPFEFFMNRLRLVEACPKQDYQAFTGQTLDAQTRAKIEQAIHKGLLDDQTDHWQVTSLGRRYLNTLLETLV
ncbi:radical SAM family heme chaperone HemW [Aestuariibacter halophilus]|uniref:Heme chaperone HemW n=1 Tax=Fluctibacter halophilus TaxID=226011 RepID=A0ABS8G8Y3_9ALTE|nr:radical SAM family heme chaperone HemW [Aestuariibacter halophilus]MCC2616631.1 radical SAM family heme chaperone HemW [Aestuariibacter halophilus]